MENGKIPNILDLLSGRTARAARRACPNTKTRCPGCNFLLQLVIFWPKILGNLESAKNQNLTEKSSFIPTNEKKLTDRHYLVKYYTK